MCVSLPYENGAKWPTLISLTVINPRFLGYQVIPAFTSWQIYHTVSQQVVFIKFPADQALNSCDYVFLTNIVLVPSYFSKFFPAVIVLKLQLSNELIAVLSRVNGVR